MSTVAPENDLRQIQSQIETTLRQLQLTSNEEHSKQLLSNLLLLIEQADKHLHPEAPKYPRENPQP